ncbi:hypothetical protein psyc5s11_16580 [Clostridium gelidum]|uniref:N-acetylmuramoyl-L-alanine amidase n=1 Tax=Clostridium gelidum TaxID=704125 RepID=A0ABM7T108_9CLOT|nr:leucine-rich repeat domain-containing protein [Clostridium gelidum]BCZ45591.1 hypothetical protein psyc5s11_16580 [Clostridium gelidum]
MIKHNKFILGLLALAISTSVISYNTTVRANAEETMQLYHILTDDRLPIHEAIDKNGITWEYKELSDGTLFIVRAKNAQAHMEVPSQINGKNVSIISDVPQYPEFKDYLSADERKDHVIQSVIIPSTVKFIESGAFACVNLTDVQLPTTTWVGKGAFMSTPWYEKQRDSKGLIIINGRLLDAENQSGDITIPSNVKEIAEGAFSGNMTSVTIPTGVIDIGENAFSNCSNIKSIVIPNGITEIKPGTFSRCYKLEDVTIPNSVTKIGKEAFSNCSKLENITIPDSVTEIDEGAFSYCSSLKKVKIPNNTQLGFDAFDDEVTIIKNGVSYNFKDINKKSSNTAQTTTPAINNVPQKATVQQGWHKDGNYWNWLWSDGSKRNGWYNEGENWYYFYGNGQMATGFIDLGGGFKYYLKPNSGDGKAVMAIGGEYIAGDWYYFNSASNGYKGAMKRGWIYDGGNWYYFYSSGQMAHNTTIDGYYVNSSGAWVS